LIAYGEVIWFGGKVTKLTMVSFGFMVLSSVVAAYSDIAGVLINNNLSMPHTPDSLAGGSIDPTTHFKSPAFDALGDQKAEIMALEAQGSQGQVLDGLGGGYAVLNSGYVWMALNCAFSAAYVLAMRKRIKVTGFKDWDTMFYNNLLTIPVLIVMSLVSTS
jgi:GDP-mannose transporter